jgi:NitT/TauT family transport system substrate-binding protein
MLNDKLILTQFLPVQLKALRSKHNFGVKMLSPLIVLLAIILLAACTTEQPASETTALTPIRLPMGYIPDPQYAPFYVADSQGYFADAGFDVEFDYSFETDGVASVGAGKLPFAVVSGEQALLARAQGVPVVYVAEWFQRYPIAVVSKAETGIESPQDLIGRTVGIPGFFGASYVGYAGLLSANGIDQQAVNGTDIGFTQFEQVANDQVEAAIVYINNEPVRLQQEGYDINIIPVADYIDLVANGIITNETMITENPEQVSAFVNALLKGVAFTLENPDEAYAISKTYVEGLDDSRMAVLEASLPLWQADQPGFTSPESWEVTQAILLEMGFLSEPLADLEAAYSNQFLVE